MDEYAEIQEYGATEPLDTESIQTMEDAIDLIQFQHTLIQTLTYQLYGPGNRMAC